MHCLQNLARLLGLSLIFSVAQEAGMCSSVTCLAKKDSRTLGAAPCLPAPLFAPPTASPTSSPVHPPAVTLVVSRMNL